MADASFLLRPRWLLSHVLVVLAVVVMVNLGFWQLDRLDQRRDRNDLIQARQDQPVVPVEDVLAPDEGDEAVDEARYRSVQAAGEYLPGETVVVNNRSQDGIPGVWLLTPVELAGGDRVAVVRGFVAGDPEVAATYEPPSGEVAVTGVVASADGFDGTAPQDIEPVVDQEGMLPGVVMAESSTPEEPAGELQPVALPDLDEGPHLSYAVQWFIFATIATVGYPLVLRSLVKRRASGRDELEAVAAVRVNGDRDPVGGGRRRTTSRGG